jgi:hypothetical protein
MSDLVMVDNVEGFGSYIVNADDEYDFETVHINIKDTIVYGEMENPDCPQNGEGGFCHRVNKYGLLTSSGLGAGKDFHIGTTSPLPPHNIMAIATMQTNVEFHNITFRDFYKDT